MRGGAIVLDGGPSASVPLGLLKDRGVNTLEALIISHNDYDHDKGACEVLINYKDALKRLLFLEDRPIQKIRIYSLARRINDDRRKGRLPTIPMYRLAHDGRNVPVFLDERRGLEPSMSFTRISRRIWKRGAGAGTSEIRPCAVLLLKCGSRRIVFSGDAPIEAWRWMISDSVFTPPLLCDILVVPHHGGVIWGSVADDLQLRNELHWLYTQAVVCEHAVLSVGTNNQHGHPIAAGVEILRDAVGCKILCTQVTSQCCDEPEKLRPGVIAPELFSRSHHSKSHQGHVACAGSLMVDIGPNQVKVGRLKEHQTAVDRLNIAQGGHPLCRERVVSLPQIVSQSSGDTIPIS